MAAHAGILEIDHHELSTTGSIKITVPPKMIDAVFNHALVLQHEHSANVGFGSRPAPKTYIQNYYQEAIITHLKEFFFKYGVCSFLYNQLHEKKILFVGEPRLTQIDFQPSHGACYYFEYSAIPKVSMRDWRYLPFKAPARKKYQDIDKQATLFITQESTAKKSYKESIIAPGDWVLFEVVLLDNKNKPLLKGLSELLWIQISDEETGEPFRQLFVGKSVDDKFVTNSICLQEYFGCSLDLAYSFAITIKEILPSAYFCLDLFKNQFRLKSERKAHQKMVEVYSFRNDVSLRRSMVEEAFTLLAKTYPFEVPTAAVLRQEKAIRDVLQNQQDYMVYKLQHDFERNIHLLAQKQVREHMIADYFASQENLNATDDDIYQYLNLTKRSRTKEFIYFAHPIISSNEEEAPVQHEILRLYCRKEKAVNHLLYQWSKP